MSLPAKAYVLCSNPRSGTTLLCDLLAQTGVAGKPDSFFRKKSLLEWCEAWGITAALDMRDAEFSRQYFDAMRQEGTDGTGVFGLRLMGPDLNFAGQWLSFVYPDFQSDHARFTAAFGQIRYIHLSRQDKLAEAVSYVRAEQTGLWHSHADGRDMERMAPTAPAGYDASVLTKQMQALQAYDAAWDAWFSAERIAPLRLTYEALARSPRRGLAQVLAFIGQDPDLAKTAEPGIRRLADDISADWIARYRSEFPGT